MKNRNIVLISGLLALAPAVGLHAQVVANSGDLILGFSDPSNAPGAGELVVDIGSANTYASAASSFTVTQFSTADLNSIYSGDVSNGNVSWSVFGGNGATALGGSPGAPTNELWLSSSGAVIDDGRVSAQQGPSGSIAAFVGALNGAVGGLTSVQASQSTGYDALLTGAGTYGYGSVNTQNTTVGTTSLTLYELTNTGTHGSTSTPGIDLGVFTLSSSGLTFTPTAIPEPSTYAAILGALSIGFVMVRRRLRSSSMV
jgi:hypothetical protein